LTILYPSGAVDTPFAGTDFVGQHCFVVQSVHKIPSTAFGAGMLASEESISGKFSYQKYSVFDLRMAVLGNEVERVNHDFKGPRQWRGVEIFERLEPKMTPPSLTITSAVSVLWTACILGCWARSMGTDHQLHLILYVSARY
jgi:hypothetical protein